MRTARGAAGAVGIRVILRVGEMDLLPWLDFNSGYVVRAMDKFPKQGAKAPWRLHQNYALDLMSLRYAKLEDGAMEFSNPERAPLRIAAE